MEEKQEIVEIKYQNLNLKQLIIPRSQEVKVGEEKQRATSTKLNPKSTKPKVTVPRPFSLATERRLNSRQIKDNRNVSPSREQMKLKNLQPKLLKSNSLGLRDQNTVKNSQPKLSKSDSLNLR